ncbi:MAG: MetQ/NlpA family ABC transporter substrate-binding protein [Treponema sp.]|nr:MetQ/NlpA family ABC transporter substrate-binding protein [Candidatus Treponema scatequi]
MKKIASIALALACAATLFAAPKKSNSKVIKIGATPEPHAEMLNLIKDDVKAAGYELKVIEFTDYVTPNEALESGEIDANFFQHLPYMDSFNKEKGFHLVNAGGIHIEPIALYSKKVSKLDDIKKGAVIAIPNDPTNEGRALLLLQEAGLITLDPKAGIEATPIDIKKNPKNLKFKEIEAATLPRVLIDVDAAVINGNYAIPAGLVATKDGLFVEGSKSPYVNIITVKKGNENDAAVKAVVKALQTQKVKDWVAKRYPNGEVVVVF